MSSDVISVNSHRESLRAFETTSDQPQQFEFARLVFARFSRVVGASEFYSDAQVRKAVDWSLAKLGRGPELIADRSSSDAALREALVMQKDLNDLFRDGTPAPVGLASNVIEGPILLLKSRDFAQAPLPSTASGVVFPHYYRSPPNLLALQEQGKSQLDAPLTEDRNPGLILEYRLQMRDIASLNSPASGGVLEDDPPMREAPDTGELSILRRSLHD